MDNPEKHEIHKLKKNKAKHNMSWTPLYANKQRKQEMTHDEGSWTDEQNIIFIRK